MPMTAPMTAPKAPDATGYPDGADIVAGMKGEEQQAQAMAQSMPDPTISALQTIAQAISGLEQKGNPQAPALKQKLADLLVAFKDAMGAGQAPAAPVPEEAPAEPQMEPMMPKNNIQPRGMNESTGAKILV